jgi:hypothetical protein
MAIAKDTNAIPRRAPCKKFIWSPEIQFLSQSLNSGTIGTESNATNVSAAKMVPLTLSLLSIILLPKESGLKGLFYRASAAVTSKWMTPLMVSKWS